MAKINFYCMKCKAKTTDTDKYQVVKTENGRSMATTACVKCGTKVSQFVKA